MQWNGAKLYVANGPSNSVSVIDTARNAVIKEIEDLVAKYNDVLAYIREQSKYDSTSRQAGLLLGNYAVQIVKSELDAIATDATYL